MTIETQHPELIVEHLASGWLIIRLNRPKALHALDESLAKAVADVLIAAEVHREIKAVWLDSSTPKAFCAGGDVRQLRTLMLEGKPDEAKAFFKEEYIADLKLHQLTKPIVTWGEGYVMGGGMGLMMGSSSRLVTPSSRLAMPEITIGLFPDVGGSRFLAQSGIFGLFLGLTGVMIDAGDAHLLNWATHQITSNKDTVLARLQQIDWSAAEDAVTAERRISDALAGLHQPQVGAQLTPHLKAIAALNLGRDFLQDYQALTALSESPDPWLAQAGQNLKNGSPSSAALTWLLWQWARETSRPWAQVFHLERQLAEWKISHPDFNEGVRARLVDKDNAPKWQVTAPESLAHALCGVPVTDDASWMAVLQRYHVVG